MYDLNDNFLERFDNISDVYRKYGFGVGAIM